MSLVLSLKEGQDFYVGEERFVVAQILGEMRFTLQHSIERTIGRVKLLRRRVYEVSDDHSIEVLPDVYVAAGDNQPSGRVRVAIDAPKEVLILRGEKKRVLSESQAA